MEPVSLAVGLGLSIAGTFMQVNAANKAAQVQKQILGEQQNQESIKQQSMQLDARRRQREMIRQGIIAKAQALTVGTSQGAAFGSGLQGAYGQIAGQTNWSMAGVDSAVAFGNQMFQSNKNIFGMRQSEADAGSQAALGQGISSLGGKVAGSSKALGNIFG